MACIESMRGLSLHGTVLKTDRELLRLHLDIDQSQDAQTAYDYTWRPETGNLMYLMPEAGTRVSLYMQDEDEFSAICKNSDRTNGEQFPEAQNPDDRYLTTAHGKRMFWMPGEAGFTSLSVNSSVKLDDAVGAIIKSSGTLLLQADGEVIVAGNRVNLSAPKEVTVVRRKVGTPTVLNASYNFDIVGNIGGFCTTNPPGPVTGLDSPLGELEEFDISDIADMIVAAVPADTAPKSTSVSAALQGTFVSHMPNTRR